MQLQGIDGAHHQRDSLEGAQRLEDIDELTDPHQSPVIKPARDSYPGGTGPGTATFGSSSNDPESARQHSGVEGDHYELLTRDGALSNNSKVSKLDESHVHGGGAYSPRDV